MEKEGKVTPSLEDYLETIYFIGQKNTQVRVTDVAADMGISKPSVNKAINILKEKSLVDHEHYGLLSLTKTGEEIAKNVAYRHLVLKKFLYELLQVDEKTAEVEACKIEHSISPETIEKLSSYLDTALVKRV